MSDDASPNRAGWRPRFSLLTALLLTAIIAMAIVIALFWREIGPLRASNRQMRTELGQLNIDDTKKAYVVTLPVFESDTWKWRLYLPPGRQYSLYNYSGHLPSTAQIDRKEWFDAVINSGVGLSTNGLDFVGEMTIASQAFNEKDQWVLATKHTYRSENNVVVTSGGRTTISQPNGDWLSDVRNRIASFEVSAAQSSYDPERPIVLLLVQRPEVETTSGGGYSVQAPTGAADGFIMWIQPTPPEGGGASSQP